MSILSRKFYCLRYLLSFLIATLLYSNSASGQINLQTHYDIGINQVSEGRWSNLSLLTSLKTNKYSIASGLSLYMSNRNEKVLNAYFLSASRKTRVFSLPIGIEVSYRHIPFSKDMRDINWCLIFSYSWKHYKLNIGNNYRIFKYSNKAEKRFGFSEKKNTRIREPWNIMYSFTYFIKPIGNKWNVSASIRNFDYLQIQQETNPMIKFNYSYRTAANITLFTELWYQSAGLMNIRVNYFGIKYRIGLIWKIN